MDVLFIGQAYIDITFLTDVLPEGDQKMVADDYAVSFGGNAVTAAFACARLGLNPDLLCVLADDWLGRMFLDMADRYHVAVHARKVHKSALSFVMPRGMQRAIVRCRDDDYLHPFPTLSLGRCQALHIDGHQPTAALHYAQACRQAGIMTSLDGGSVRDNTDAVLDHIDIAIVSEDFCRQRGQSPTDTIDFLIRKGASVAGVTLGTDGLLWRERENDPGRNHDNAREIRHMPALDVPADRIIDTNGAGDIFHGAYMASWLRNRGKPWHEHFAFARAASAHAIQHLGNEASLPTDSDIATAMAKFAPKLENAGPSAS